MGLVFADFRSAFFSIPRQDVSLKKFFFRTAMNVRNYNIYFHTHTVSGIIITALLYIIFFAGSFAFFKKEISNWQKNSPNDVYAKEHTDYNAIIDSLGAKNKLYGRDISFFTDRFSNRISVSFSESKDTTQPKAKKRGRRGSFFILNPITKEQQEYNEAYDLGEFLYRLHFFAQLNSVAKLGFPLGYYIAGIVAIMFLFALITGLLLHWEKIVSNFYLFRPWEKLKTVWTDLHTALGVVSFPFLLVFSITGAYFLVSSALFTPPVVAFQYGGNEDSLYADMGYRDEEVKFLYTPLSHQPDLNAFKARVKKEWGEGVWIEGLEIHNYGDKSMRMEADGRMRFSEKFTSDGKFVTDAEGNVLTNEHPNRKSSYADVVDNLMYVLHFGNYGGYATKILYFILGIAGCMVIVSGVLIWLTARNKNNIPERKRKFNLWLTHIYLSICLSMYPVTAIAFIVVKLYPNEGMDFIYRVYFYTWLAFSVLLLLRRNNYKTNRDCLLLGSIIGICIPIVNGIVTRNWIWISFQKRYHDILLIDLFWLFLSISTFTGCYLMIRKQKTKKAAIPKAKPAEV